MKAVLVWFAATAILTAAYAATVIHIPRGSAVKVDGKVSPGEWDDSSSVRISVGPDWNITVRFKYDAENLYFLFAGVEHTNQRLFPEIVVDPQHRTGTRWQKGQWWLHVSYNLCEGDGEPNVYRKAGVFQCAHQKAGWEGNNPPYKDTRDVEIRVSFSKLKIRPSSGLHFGLAFAVTDATGDANQKWFFWPVVAAIDTPNTWADAVLDN